MSVRQVLRPEGKCPDTPRPDDIYLDTLHLNDMRYIQKANALTLLIWKADAIACIVWKTFALTTYVGKTCAAFRR